MFSLSYNNTERNKNKIFKPGELNFCFLLVNLKEEEVEEGKSFLAHTDLRIYTK